MWGPDRTVEPKKTLILGLIVTVTDCRHFFGSKLKKALSGPHMHIAQDKTDSPIVQKSWINVVNDHANTVSEY